MPRRQADRSKQYPLDSWLRSFPARPESSIPTKSGSPIAPILVGWHQDDGRSIGCDAKRREGHRGSVPRLRKESAGGTHSTAVRAGPGAPEKTQVVVQVSSAGHARVCPYNCKDCAGKSGCATGRKGTGGTGTCAAGLRWRVGHGGLTEGRAWARLQSEAMHWAMHGETPPREKL